MVKKNNLYGEPIRVYGAVEFGFSDYRFNELTKERLANYNGGIVLEYDDRTVAYAKVSHGVLNGVYIRYPRGCGFYSCTPLVRGQFKKGLPEGTWSFNQWIEGEETGTQINVLVNYKAGKVVGKPQKSIVVGNESRPLSAAEKYLAANVRCFRAPRLQKSMARRLATKRLNRQMHTLAPQQERDY